MNQDLVQLYEKIASITAPICASGKDECGKYQDNPSRCCERKYCEIAAENAMFEGVELKPVSEDIPFLSSAGCIVPPYLRPICSVHVCSISYAARSHIENDPDKTKRYFDLRKRIRALESQP